MISPEMPQQSPIVAETPLVTIVPNLETFEITGLTETPTERTHTWNKPDIAGRAGDRLAELYMTMGQGVFTLGEIRTATGWDSRGVTSTGTQLANALPEEVFYVEGKGAERRLFFGNFRIASRMADDRELEAFAAATKVKEEGAFEQEKQAVAAAEASKINLTEVDHALVRTEDEVYYLPMTTVGSVIAARAFQALKTLHDASKSPLFTFSELHKIMWGNMTLAERQLFTSTENVLYGNGRVLGKTTEAVIQFIMKPLSIAQRQRQTTELELGSNSNFELEFMSDPPKEPYDTNTIGAIYSPGTQKAVVRAHNLREALPDELAAMRSFLDKVRAAPRLTHDNAIGVLDIVMNKRTKDFALGILSQQSTPESAQMMLDHLNRRSQAALGHRYDLARKQRTIGGTKGASTIQLVSGRLPGRTFGHIGDSRSLTQQWHIVKKHEG